MYWTFISTKWWSLSSFLILSLIPFAYNLDSNINIYDLIQSITIEDGKNWGTGFLLPPSWLNKPSAVKSSPLFTYDFYKPGHDNKSFEVSLMFHEYYHRCKIFVCTRIQEEFTPVSALLIHYSKHKANLHPFKRYCQFIDPMLEDLVYRNRGPVFVEVLCDNQLSYIPERHHLMEERGGLYYNFTYEITIGNHSQEHHVENNTFDVGDGPCHNNGYLVLKEKPGSMFEFSCNCLLGTNGSSCQWGPNCPPSDDRSMCNNHGSCWSRPIEKNHVCLCDKDYIGPTCNHFTAFYNPDGYHNLNVCKTNETCHFCYQFPNKVEKCSCNMGYQLSSSGKCIPDSLLVILKYEVFNTSSITKFDVANKITNLFSCNNEFEIPNLVKQISIDERSKIIRLHEFPNDKFSQINNNSFWKGEIRVSPCMKISKAPKKVSSCATEQGVFSDVNLHLSLIRVQYSQTVIKMFRENIVNSTLKKICCLPFSNDFSVTFFKEGKVINQQPFNLSTIKNMAWQSGDLQMESHDKVVCLKFGQASDIDDGVYTCRVEDQYYTEEKELFVKQSKPRLAVDVEPEAVTVSQGENITINCTVKNKTFFTFHPRLSFYTNLPNSTASNYPLKTRTISLTLSNVKRDINVTCNATDENNIKKYYAEKHVIVEVLDPARPFCNSNSSYGIYWHTQKASSTSKRKCPQGYTGYCSRDCTEGRDSASAFWELPDCSQCERTEISDLVKNISLYSRGIKSFLPYPNLILNTIENILSKKKNFLPGEMSSILRVLNYCLTVLPFDYDFEDFYSLLNTIMSKDNFIFEKDYENLEALMNRLPLKFFNGKYVTRYTNKETVISYLSVPFSHEYPYNILFSSEDVSNKKRSISFSHLRKQQTVRPNISILIYDKQKRAKIVSITVFKKPYLFFKHQKRIVKRETVPKTLDESNLDEQMFGKVISPLIQARLFTEHQLLNDEQEKISAVFEPCVPQTSSDVFASISTSNYRCGRYIPKERIWNTTGCTFNLTEENCTCTCVGFGGWIGLVDNNLSKHTEIIVSHNVVAAVGCMIATVTLTLTIIVLMIRCGFWSTQLLTKVIECLALLVSNVVFFSCSVTNIGNTDQLALLIIISGSLVLALSMSICHQIDILTKYHEFREGPQTRLELANPSFLLTFACVLISAMLGAILWTISRVKSITPSNAWLPENDEASSLSLVVFCCLSLLLLLICIMASISWLKLNSINLHIAVHSDGTQFLFKELKKSSFLTFVKIIFISSSIYQDKYVGKYIFLFASILLGICYLILYTCENLRSTNSSPSCSHSELQANEVSKRKLCDMKGCLYRWLCSASVIYSGVAGTEVSPLPNDDSIEFRKRDDSLCSPNSSVKNEENDNCLKSQMQTNWGTETGRNKEFCCTCFTEHPSFRKVNNSSNVIVSIEKVCLNEKQSASSAFRLPLNYMKIPKSIRNLDNGNHQNHAERYLSMNGNKAKLDFQKPRYVPMNGNHRKDTEIQIFYENDKTEDSDSKMCSRNETSKSFGSGTLHKKYCFNSKTLERSNFETCITNSCTLPHMDKRKKIFSNFSSKFSLLGIKTKRVHKNMSSGRIATSSSDNCERSILINGDNKIFINDVNNPQILARENYWKHRRQHSY